MKPRVQVLSLAWVLAAILFAGDVGAQVQPAVRDLLRGNTQFALDLYGALATEKGNLFLSPFSISAAGALVYGAAGGSTAKQLEDVLYLPRGDQEVHRAFELIQTRIADIQKAGDTRLSFATALWPQEGYPLRREYLRLAKRSYGAEIAAVDYGKAAESAQRQINEWVERHTEGRITNILTKAPEPETRLILANAIYFKGTWLTEFRKSVTALEPFYVTRNEPVKVPTMKLTSSFGYAEGNSLQVLQMPYVGRQLAMMILLPREIESLGDLEAALTPDNLGAWTRDLDTTEVAVSLPRFEMTYGFDLKDALIGLGVRDAFRLGKADFSGLTERSAGLYIGSAVHKAFVKVNEEGTEAAAATVGGGCFPAGTIVLTASGPRTIETVGAGTKVHAFDFRSGSWTLVAVRRRLSHRYDGDMITIHAGGGSFQATGNHPFYVLRGQDLDSRPVPADVPGSETGAYEQGRWVEARDLRAGDVLMVKGGAGLLVGRVASRRESDMDVYNLDVDGPHNYAVHAEGILVHNKGSASVPPVPFVADHPFLFLIRDLDTGNILFMGRLVQPG